MTAKKSYNRYFIIFQEEDKGYGMAIDKQPTGYTKIETRNGRCKITVYAQNLVKDRGPYHCCLIDATKNPVAIAKLGKITVDETGRGETWWEYREDDVAETGIPVDRFNVAAVIVEGDELRAPLTGYIGRDKINWKDKIKPAASEVKEELQETMAEEEIPELDEEARKFKEYEEMIKGQALKDETEKDKILEDSKEEEHRNKEEKGDDKEDNSQEGRAENVDEVDSIENNEDASRETPESDKEVEVSKEEDNNGAVETVKEDDKDAVETMEDLGIEDTDTVETFKDNMEEDRDDFGDYEDIISDVANIDNQFDDIYYREDRGDTDWGIDDEFSRDERKKYGKHARMFHEVLRHFKEVDNPVDGMKDVRWWKIPHGDDTPVRENRLYPYFCSIYHLKMTYPYINYIKYFKKPGYYHFGIKYDSNGEVKYIMYAIEGRNSALEQPYMGMTGFTKWYGFKCKDKEKEKGMWIMYYNPYTGCILIPKNK